MKNEKENKKNQLEENKNSKVSKIKELKNKKRIKAIILSIIVLVIILLVTGIVIYELDVNNKTFNGNIANIFSSNNEITEDDAINIAIKRFNQLGEKDLNKENLQILKILRKGNFYYYISSPDNSLEISITNGKIVRENSVLVEK